MSDTKCHKTVDSVMFISFRVPFRARLGEWDSAQNIEPLPVIDMDVTKVVIHPQYSPKNLRFDLAILFLDRPVELGASPTIAHICLPSQPLSNLRCWVSGDIGSRRYLKLIY